MDTHSNHSDLTMPVFPPMARVKFVAPEGISHLKAWLVRGEGDPPIPHTLTSLWLQVMWARHRMAHDMAAGCPRSEGFHREGDQYASCSSFYYNLILYVRTHHFCQIPSVTHQGTTGRCETSRQGSPGAISEAGHHRLSVLLVTMSPEYWA